MVWLRKFHLYLGFALVPLVLVQALTGLLLRLRAASELAHLVHTWFKYRYDFSVPVARIGVFLGLVTALGLVLLVVSGATLYVNMRIQQRRRARRRPD